MRIALFLAAPLLLLSAHASAEGIQCRPLSGPGPILTITVADSGTQAVLVSLRDGDRIVAAEVGKNFINYGELSVDLINPRSGRVEAKLRAKVQHYVAGQPAVGTLAWRKKKYSVRCTES
jgi:hypothetical protein